ncbi:L-threonylcarbamoyladenylate synthase [Arthrobacter cryoconiti]|uniref:L-threonylcarbamoyladenylate synthase n=1 Tax=Arthrobacter cryoconiti TaxID=748907 RepID=A0ABV8QZ37_9MICC
MSTTSYNCTNVDQRVEGLAHAQKAIAAKQLVVIPTDTVYGVAADAFSPQAVAMLLAAKGRGRNMPPPVLMPRIGTMDGLATEIPDDARKLAEKYWPGPLTLILHAQPSLTWDLGETVGTVALRVPDDQLALDLLTLTGPLAVSSANRTGQPAGQTGAAAREQLAESVEVYLDDGFRPVEGSDGVPSTIVDATGLRLRVVRLGGISLEEIQRMIPSALGDSPEPEMWSPSAEPQESERSETVEASPEDLVLEEAEEAEEAEESANFAPDDMNDDVAGRETGEPDAGESLPATAVNQTAEDQTAENQLSTDKK